MILNTLQGSVKRVSHFTNTSSTKNNSLLSCLETNENWDSICKIWNIIVNVRNRSDQLRRWAESVEDTEDVLCRGIKGKKRPRAEREENWAERKAELGTEDTKRTHRMGRGLFHLPGGDKQEVWGFLIVMLIRKRHSQSRILPPSKANSSGPLQVSARKSFYQTCCISSYHFNNQDALLV